MQKHDSLIVLSADVKKRIPPESRIFLKCQILPKRYLEFDNEKQIKDDN